eukprot:tig00001107_g7101.t1
MAGLEPADANELSRAIAVIAKQTVHIQQLEDLVRRGTSGSELPAEAGEPLLSPTAKRKRASGGPRPDDTASVAVSSALQNAELAQSRAQCEELQLEISKMRAAREAESVNDAKTIDQLRRQRRYLLEVEGELKARLKSVEEESRKTKEDVEQRAREVEKERASLADKVRALESSLRDQKGALAEAEQRAAAQQKALQIELEELRERVDEGRRKAKEVEKQLEEGELAQAALMQLREEQKVLRSRADAHEEAEAVIRSLRAEIRSLEEGVGRRGRAGPRQSENVELLSEELEAAQQRAARAEEAATASAAAAARADVLAAEVAGWCAPRLASRGPGEAAGSGHGEGKATAGAVAAHVQLLQKDRALLADQLGVLAAQAAALEARVAALSRELEGARGEAEKAGREAAAVQEASRRCERRLAIALKERDGFKRIIDSYGEELTMANVDKLTQERAGLLEESLGEERKLVAELQARLAAQADPAASAAPSSVGQVSAAVQLREENERLKVQGASLERECEQLSKRVAELEARLGRGEYNAASAKVLHMRFNPAVVAAAAKMGMGPAGSAASSLTADMEAMRGENERLKQRVAALEADLLKRPEHGAGQAEGAPGRGARGLQTPVTPSTPATPGSAGAGAAPLAGEAAERERERLREQVRDAQKNVTRMKEVFKRSVQEFREACYNLFGYKMSMMNQEYQLLSAFAESERDVLRFKLDEQGRMQMLETEYCCPGGRVPADVLESLRISHSIPAFLASLTLHLMQNQTQI